MGCAWFAFKRRHVQWGRLANNHRFLSVSVKLLRYFVVPWLMRLYENDPKFHLSFLTKLDDLIGGWSFFYCCLRPDVIKAKWCSINKGWNPISSLHQGNDYYLLKWESLVTRVYTICSCIKGFRDKMTEKARLIYFGHDPKLDQIKVS